MKLWVGKEREGFHKGKKTLFIGSPEITFKDIKNALLEYPNITQLYFGAGICSEINQYVVGKCLKENNNLTITLEVDIKKLDKIKENIIKNQHIDFMISTSDKNYSLIKNILPHKLQIKIQSLNGEKLVAVGDYMGFYKTDMDIFEKKTYKGDVILK